MPPAIITLTTDFGTGSPYVAELKGVILSIAPRAIIVDITHTIAPQDILQGALVLEQVVPTFPAASIHVAIVDPGVGSARRILLAKANESYLIAPDNGLLSRALDWRSAGTVRVVDKPEFWRRPVSFTFHGRDIMAPVAAHLAGGQSPEVLTSPSDRAPVLLEIPRPKLGSRTIEGEVLTVDSFGNLRTNLHSSLLEAEAASGFRVVFAGSDLRRVETYSEGSPGEVVSLIGSQGWLEIAVVQGHAAATLHAGRGQPVRVTW